MQPYLQRRVPGWNNPRPRYVHPISAEIARRTLETACMIGQPRSRLEYRIALFRLRPGHPRHANETGIVYCFSRKECEEVAQALRDRHGLKAQHYHAKMTSTQKKLVQEQWQSGGAHVIVCTVSVTVSIVHLKAH